MSLIQEALSRKEEENHVERPPARAPTPPRSVQPPAPTRHPDPPRPVKPVTLKQQQEAAPINTAAGAKKPARTWTVLLGVFLTIAILVAACAGVLYYAWDQWNESDPGLTGEEQNDPETTTAAVADPDDDTGQGTGTSTTGRQAVAAPAGKPAGGNDPTTGTDSAESNIPWPQVTLKGIVGKGKSGTAVIDDSVIGVDETVKGVRLVSIEEQGVELEYRGERRFLRVGKSTR